MCFKLVLIGFKTSWTSPTLFNNNHFIWLRLLAPHKHNRALTSSNWLWNKSNSLQSLCSVASLSQVFIKADHVHIHMDFNDWCVDSLSWLTRWEAVVGAAGAPPTVAVRFHGDGVVGAAGDASHEAVVVLRVAAGVTARRRQRRDEWVGAFGRRPRDVGGRLSHLVHCQSLRAARLCQKQRESRNSEFSSPGKNVQYANMQC